jgi:hypothetical protein
LSIATSMRPALFAYPAAPFRLSVGAKHNSIDARGLPQ